ncbi:MAG: DUF2807 domain-containing protein [Verrucomicrobiota bacterium]
MKKPTILALGVLLVLVTGCTWPFGIRGDGQITTDQRSIGAFDELQASGSFDIQWRNGPPSLSITTDRNLLQYISGEITDNRLRLRTRERLSPSHGIKVVVMSPSRNGAKISGAVDLTVPELAGPKFYFQSTGASDVKLDGNIDELLADMTGASDLNAKNLHTKIAEISTTGAADADISVSETLRVSITGAGTVNYHGNPPTIEKHVTGAGSIRHKD